MPITLYAIKPYYQKLFRGLAGNWMTPNMATEFGVLFSFMTCASFILGGLVNHWFFLLVPFALAFRMGANALDGMLAREKGLASPLGAVLNEITDVINDVICYAPLWFLPEVSRGLLFIFIILIFSAEFSGLLGQAVTGTRRYEGPCGGKTDRSLWMGLFAIACAFRPGVFRYIGPYMAIVCVFVLLTMINRLRLIVVEAEKKASPEGA
ncbi:MAG: CDP-alcohol phosphatidyltransferase family protein [Kiritimatiellae bacterium]|nr:CDP-alcohol phosphatidyltransferase family protein [Kiritimatiellia bacterium]